MKTTRIVLLVAIAGAALAPAAQAKPATALAGAQCPPLLSASTALAAFGDTRTYFPAPGGTSRAPRRAGR